MQFLQSRKLKFFALAGLALAACVLIFTVLPFFRVYSRSSLPANAVFFSHPQKSGVQYCFVEPGRHSVLKFLRTRANLYRSADGGSSWQLCRNSLAFNRMFMHPETGVLYCSVTDHFLSKDSSGVSRRAMGDKAFMSADGEHWQDISGGDGHFCLMAGIMADPDAPGRVCLKVSSIRTYVLQSPDDAYSRWICYRETDWPRRAEIRKRSDAGESKP